MRRSKNLALLCSTLLLAACGGPAQALAAPTKTHDASSPCGAPSTGPWSEAKDGLRGRLVATSVRDAEGRPQLRLDLELENVSDEAMPIEVSWANLGSVLDLSLEDERGTPVQRSAVGGNEFSIPPYALLIPVESAIRITVSPAAYEYPTTGATWLRPLTFQAWDMTQARGTRLYMKARVIPASSVHPQGKAWVGPLDLPRVELPAS